MNVIDSHIHIYTGDCVEYFSSYCEKNLLSAVNACALACLNKNMENDAAQNILCAIFKLKNNTEYNAGGDVFCHGCLVYPAFPVTLPIEASYNFERQAKELMEIGFDGIKMLEAKPTSRKLTAFPTDSSEYDSFYSYLEKNRIHIISHVADPETFWCAETAPEFSFKEGWFYGDGTFPDKEELYKETLSVLDKHPDLTITFAHFFFLSDFPERASEIMEKYKNVRFDLTPGREMYGNFSKRRDFWRGFFTKYQDRIMLGTDVTASEFQGKPSEIIGTIIRFLSTSDEFSYWGLDIKGLGLNASVCEKITSGNFLSLCGKNPKEIDKKALTEYARRFIGTVKDKKTQEYIRRELEI